MTKFLFDGILDKTSFSYNQLSEIIRDEDQHYLFRLFVIAKNRFFPFIRLFLFYIYRVLKYKVFNKQCDGTVLYFSVENFYDLASLLYHNRSIKRHVLWFWNPVSTFGSNKYSHWLYVHLFIPILKFLGVELWSFDKADANKYMLKYHPQVHNSLSLMRSGFHEFDSDFLSDKSFLFVGFDKGRLHKLSELKSILSKFNILCDFHIIADVGKKYSSLDRLLVKHDHLPYADYLHRISNSFGLIDFVQDGQSGLTLRVLEAVFLRKKLITNNLSVKDYDFYNASNIFVLEGEACGDDINQLSLFLNSDFVEIDDVILEKYDINHLLKSIFE
ncbi:hypothetical protein ACK363_11235 [Aeromonas veronii]|uniref:hypothetical protein n=1 Tax=Aeromonas caviae TaxID=648 RepID=UPI00385856F2